MLENDRNDAALLDARRRSAGRAAYTAQWNDDFHHALYVLLTGETRGHYVDYPDTRARSCCARCAKGSSTRASTPLIAAQRAAAASAELPPEAFVNFLQNHDQIGNRPDAARMWMLLEPQRMLAAETLLALLPTPILLFMGDEFHAPSGFPFFCDFAGELARAVTEGRRNEFASLWRDVDCEPVPGPATEAARAAAVLDWTALDARAAQGALERARHRFGAAPPRARAAAARARRAAERCSGRRR